jgi:hypothetical protein
MTIIKITNLTFSKLLADFNSLLVNVKKKQINMVKSDAK